MNLSIVGIDCATDAKKTGIALASYVDGVATIVDAQAGKAGQQELTSVITEWIRSSQNPVLLALDAPLGWPVGMRAALASHQAGNAISVPVHQMVRRGTDRFIGCTHKKIPLDVGADRIARTAHWAVNLLASLRKQTDEAIPLAWAAANLPKLSAIEVYPAATMIAHDVSAAEYKKPSQARAREKLVKALRKKFENRIIVDKAISAMETDADVIDAVVCVMAAVDFLEDRAASPDECSCGEHAHIEGWIWAMRGAHKASCMCGPFGETNE